MTPGELVSTSGASLVGQLPYATGVPGTDLNKGVKTVGAAVASFTPYRYAGVVIENITEKGGRA
jgi:hypothetical protein